jgi:hypothetical protein
MPFISVTRLRVRSWFYLPGFLFAAMRVSGQAKKAPGNLAVTVFRDRRNVFWTSTSWDSEEAMRAFMLARPHGPVMRKLLEWCDEAAVVHWTQADTELPSWAEAHARMQREGRPSKVNHPTAAQTKYVIDAPPAKPKGEFRLK